MEISLRTKNRFNEHGSHWRITGRVSRGVFTFSGNQELKGVPCLRLECPSKCGWVGWIPEKEFHMVKPGKN